MNSYSLGINGSWLLAVALIILGFAFAVYSYRHTVPQITKQSKILLITFRTLALALLLFAIFEPVLTMITGSEKAPKVAVLLDNSLSTAAKDASGNRNTLYENAINSSDIESLDEENRIIALFDEDITTIKTLDRNKIDHDGQLTNISNALKWTNRLREKENIQSVLIITDGAFNSGRNPVYDADQLAKPIFVIGIGDSTEPKDISIQSILTNEVAFVDNPVPVNINVKVNGFIEGDIKLVLKDNGAIVSEQTISIHPERNLYTAIFEYMPKIKGVHKLTADVSKFEKEITYKNNRITEFIKILDNKRNIAIFAGAPSADLSFILSNISKEKGVKISSFVQKKGSEFYQGVPTAGSLQKTEIIILTGFPNKSTSYASIDLIVNELEKGKALFFFASYDTDYIKLRKLEKFLPFNTMSSNQQEFLAIPDVSIEALSSPLLRVNGTEEDISLWNQLPPLFKTETFVRVKPGSQFVAGIKVNNVAIREPLILSRSFQGKKSVAFMGYGLHRWKLFGYAADIAKGKHDKPDLLYTFLQNSIRWLSVSDKSKMVMIKTNKKQYTNTEKIEFIAQVYDAAYSPIENANVVVKISGGNEPRELILNSAGNGRYTGNIVGLSEGDFAYSGNASFNGTKLGNDNGRFTIGEIALEYQNLRMNISLLRDLAERTGGKFYLPEDAGSFIDDLTKQSSFQPKSITERTEFALWNYYWLLIVAILLFSLEWFIRKRLGMV